MKRFWCMLLAVGVLGACSGPAAAQEKEPIQVESAIVQLIEQVETPAQAAGVLESVAVAEGDYVDVGQPLAEIDRTESWLLTQRARVEVELSQQQAQDDVAVRSAEVSHQFAQRELQRIEQALARLPGSISQSEIEEAKLHIQQAELQAERARLELHRRQLEAELKRSDLQLSEHSLAIRRVQAPIPGVVVEVLRRPGEWVEPGDTVLRILRIDRLRVEGLAPVEAIEADLKNAAVEVSVAIPGREPIERSGRIVFVSPEVNAVSGQVRVWAEIDNPDGALRPGLRAEMTILP